MSATARGTLAADDAPAGALRGFVEGCPILRSGHRRKQKVRRKKEQASNNIIGLNQCVGPCHVFTALTVSQQGETGHLDSFGGSPNLSVFHCVCVCLFLHVCSNGYSWTE